MSGLQLIPDGFKADLDDRGPVILGPIGYRLVEALLAAAGKPVSYADLGKLISPGHRADERSTLAYLRAARGTLRSLRAGYDPIWPAPGFGFVWKEPA